MVHGVVRPITTQPLLLQKTSIKAILWLPQCSSPVATFVVAPLITACILTTNLQIATNDCLQCFAGFSALHEV